MSSFQALATAIAAQVGTGNVAGTATALVSGGPGALLAMPIIGGALTVSSVPLLVRAYKNRRKALAIGATSQTTSLLPSAGKGERQPAVALSLYF